MRVRWFYTAHNEETSMMYIKNKKAGGAKAGACAWCYLELQMCRFGRAGV